MPRSILAAGFIAVHVAHAGPAVEPARPDERAAEANRLFEDGRLLAKDGNHAAACRRFEESDALQRTFGTAVNLGDCAARDGHLELAWRLYDEAAHLAERDGADSRAKFARDRATALEPKLCTVIVTLADPTVAGLSVRIADRDVPPAPKIRALVDPGDIDVTIAAPHVPGLHQTLHGGAGAVVALDVPGDVTRTRDVHLAEHGPGFVVIDRFDAVSRVGVETTYSTPSSDLLSLPGISHLLRFEAHAQYIHEPSGLGGYVQFPYFYAGEAGIANSGDLELGGVFVPRLQLGGIGFVLHAGVTLPTGNSNTNDLLTTMPNATAAYYASLLVLPGLYNSISDATIGKFGISPTFSNGRFFARLDLGVDWNIKAASSYGTAFHYNAGVGIRAGIVTLALESENMTLKDPAPELFADATQITLDALAISARITTSAVSPYLAVVFPVGEDISKSVTLGAMVGIDVQLP